MTENETNLNVGSNIYMNTPYNGEQIRRAYETKPWKSDYEIYDDIIEEEQEGSDEIKGVVDLGLPSGLLWAKCNLGANSPEESGKYYQWGDTEGYYEDQILEGVKSFDWETYKYFGRFDQESGNTLLTKYCNDSHYGLDGYTDDLTTLEPSDDAATSELGNKWRIPTPDDFDELLSELSHEVTTLNDIPGVKFISKNGNELFIPFSGCVENDEIIDKDSYCNLWSSDLDTNFCICSWYLWYGSDGSRSVESYDRCEGHSIRPVNISKLKKKFEINVESNNSIAGSVLSRAGIYYEGDTCTLIAFPSRGYKFINWTKDGEVVSENSQYSFIVEEDATYIANFGVSILTQSNLVEGGTTSGGGNYTIGDTCTLVATPINGYVFQNWRKQAVRPVIVSTDQTYTFEVIATSRENSGGTYIAYFLPPQYTITVSSNPVGGGMVSGGGTYNKNFTCTLSAIPNDGYEFNNWTENGNVVSSESTYSFTVIGDRNIVANFTLIPEYTITTSCNPVEGGTVTGGGTYTEDSDCTLVANPNTGYLFENWTENGNIVSSENTYSFTVTEDRNIVANFTLQTYDIEATVNNESKGTVSGGGTYTYGNTCTLVATPSSSDYIFINWTEDGNVVSSESTYSFTVTGNKNIVANFGNLYNTITVSSSDNNGSVYIGDTPGTLQETFEYGQTCTVNSLANEGYLFNNLTENGDIVTDSATYTFIVTEDRTLVANFIEDRYLTFTANQDSSSIGFKIVKFGSPQPLNVILQYSTDNCITWNNYTIAEGNDEVSFITLDTGDSVKFRGTNPSGLANYKGRYDYTYINCKLNGSISASGDVTSLINNIGGDAELPSYCYYNMFYGCTSLTQAPQLPATTLANYCYNYMFRGCTGLVEAPVLPATTLKEGCYDHMFYDCTSLTQAPQLPATTLASHCYVGMFYDCTSLTQAPQLPATTLAHSCYQNMFSGCTSLVEAPDLPATTLAQYCYFYMFSGCTSLTQAPQLPATTLTENCYNYMFYNCTSLVEAPELPATTLAGSCYTRMFERCTSLVEAPELPATTLAGGCYSNMFYGCKKLEESPELPATTLITSCYRDMFYGCTKLGYIKCLATDISASYCTTNWVNGVSGSGIFVKNPNMNSWATGNDGIPSGWTVQDNV